jgi:hypothetical protein
MNVRPIPYGTNYRVRVTVTGTYSGYSLIPATDVSEGTFTLDPDYENPDITSNQPDEVFIEHGSSNNELSWVLNDRNPYNYSVYVDGSMVDDDFWNDDDTITLVFDGYAVGTYLVEILVDDIFDQQSSHTVTVTVEDTLKPVFTSIPDDLIYEANTTGHNVQWIVSDVNPNLYSITVNTTVVVDNHVWDDDETINFSVDGYDVGIYIITIIIDDDYGLEKSDTVIIRVVDTTVPLFIDTASDITYEMEATGNVLQWSMVDVNPKFYSIDVDGSQVVTNEPWSNYEIVSFNVDGLSVGTYPVTITIMDAFDNENSHTATVTVEDTLTPSFTSTLMTSPTK